MDATILSELDTLFKEIERLHAMIHIGSASLLDRDILRDKIKAYYVLISEMPSAKTQNNQLTTLNTQLETPIQQVEPIQNTDTSEIEIEKPKEEPMPEPERLPEPEPELIIQESQPIIEFKSNPSARKELKNLVDINTKIGLIKYFFQGDLDAYNQTLSAIDRTTSLSEAEELFSDICKRQSIDKENELAVAFRQLIQKSF